MVWRTDYNAARKEAQEKGLPLLLVVGTEDCFYCRKLEATTMRDPVINGLIANGFIAVKLDANREPALAKALRVQVYPTMLLAGSDGKIHAFIEGYLEPDRFAEHLKRTITTSTTTDWAARDYNEASKSIAAGDYSRAVPLLKGIIKDAGDKPVGVKAREILTGIERQAAGQLAKARDLDQRGQSTDALDLLTDVIRTYPGTPAATDAANLMAGISEKPETQDRQRVRRARDLLAMARQEFTTQRYYDSLQKCETLMESYSDLPEAKDASSLAADIKNNPERLARVCEQMNEKTAAMYLTLADSWMKKGQLAEAQTCLDKVVKLCPNSPHATLAQTKLAQYGGATPAVPVGFKKP
jgi:thioredoxin-like negative regulator of GroEL